MVGCWLRETDAKLGLIDAVNDAIPDPRSPRWIVHQQRAMLAQRILAIAAGYEDGNDHQQLRFDPALQIAYVLLEGLRRIALSGTDYANVRVDTIRLKLIKIATRVRVTARRIIFHLAGGCPYQSLFRHILSRLCDTS